MSDPLRREMSILSRTHMNSRCADCRAKAPPFASSTLGVFLCAPCADCHRQLPDGMSSVRSLLFDEWSEAQVAHMSALGNLRFNAHHEATLEVADRIQADAAPEARAAFVRAKYVERRWHSDTPRVCIMHAPEGGELVGSPDAAAASSPAEAVAPDAASAQPQQPSRRADQRRERMNRAAPLNALELMEHEMQRARPLAPEAIFSPAAARAALARLAASAAGPAQPLPPLHPQLTFVLTTSAVPSNPALELIERVLHSCELYLGLDKHRPAEFESDAQSAPPAAAATAAAAATSAAPAPGPLKCPLILVMDGYALDPKLPVGAKPKYKNGLLDARSISAYEEYKAGLRALIARQPYPHLHLIALELPFRQGFAGAVHQALQFVSSDYMLVLQHDWAFIRELPHSVWQLLQCMENNKPAPAPAPVAAVPAVEPATAPAATPSPEDDTPAPAAAAQQPDASPNPASLSSLSLSPSPSPSPSPCLSASSPAVAARLPINYITFQSSTTLHYLAKDYHDVRRHVGPAVHRLHHYPLDGSDAAEAAAAALAAATPAVPAMDAALPSDCEASAAPIPLAPVYFWFDRNHLVRARFYRESVFGAFRFMKSAAFIEDSYGQIMLNQLRGSYNGTKKHVRHAFGHYASFIYYPDNGRLTFVDHVHGRKWMTDAQREEKHGARDEEAREKIERRAARQRQTAGAGAAGAAGGSGSDGAAERLLADEDDVDYDGSIDDIWGE